ECDQRRSCCGSAEETTAARKYRLRSSGSAYPPCGQRFPTTPFPFRRTSPSRARGLPRTPLRCPDRYRSGSAALAPTRTGKVYVCDSARRTLSEVPWESRGEGGTLAKLFSVWWYAVHSATGISSERSPKAVPSWFDAAADGT